jgi:hypothetical protein
METTFSILVKIFDEVSNLINKKRESKKEYFNEFHRPLFDNLISIHGNYLVGLQMIKSQIKSGKKLDEILAILEEIQIEYKPLREHSISTSKVLSERMYDKKNTNYEVDFIHSIILYLTSYFGGRTAFTGIEALIDKSLRIIKSGKSLDEFLIEKNKVIGYDEYFLNEIDKIENYLIKQFTDVSLNYDRLRIKCFSN